VQEWAYKSTTSLPLHSGVSYKLCFVIQYPDEAECAGPFGSPLSTRIRGAGAPPWLESLPVSTGEKVRLSTDYQDKAAYVPRNLYSVLQAYSTHPEWKSLPPESYTGNPAYARGLLRRRPVHAEIPFHFVGKEVERHMQEGDDIALLDGRSIEYRNTRSLTEEQIDQLKGLSLDKIERMTGLSRHTIIKARQRGRVHKGTHEKLIKAGRTLREATEI
jgi:hypothetical protein